jgi:hypothetical protein
MGQTNAVYNNHIDNISIWSVVEVRRTQKGCIC